MSRFLDPRYIFFVFLLMFLGVLQFLILRKKKIWISKSFLAVNWQTLTRNLSTTKRSWKSALFYLGMFFLILGLMRFQGGKTQADARMEGFEIVIAVDVSESMMAEDMGTSRLKVVKNDLFRLLDRLAGNHVGLVAFAGVAHTLSPLTSDTQALKMYVESLSIYSVSQQGTNLQQALEESQQLLKNGGTAEGKDPIKAAQMVLMFSDGEDHEPGAIEKAQELKKQDIQIFTVAYGSEKGSPIAQRDANGNLTGYKKDSSGQTVLSKVNVGELRLLAQTGGGSSYVAYAGGDYVLSLWKDLQSAQKKIFESKGAVAYEEKMSVFLWLALICFALEIFLSEKKRTTQRLLQAVFISSFSLQPWLNNELALRHVKKNEQSSASHIWSGMIYHDETRAFAFYNLGVQFLTLDKTDQAAVFFKKAYDAAKEKNDDLIQFQSAFNLGTIYGKQKKVREAVDQYHLALDIVPGSREAKINIELLVQQNGSGKGKSDDKKDSKDSDKKDKGDQQGKGDGKDKDKDKKDQGDQKDQPKDDKDNKDKNQDQKEKSYQQNPKPKDFQSKALSPQDAKHMVDEIKNQEEKIRTDFDRSNRKERANGKDW